MSFQWLKNGFGMTDGGNVSGSATASLTLNNVQDVDAAGYAVVITNVVGSVTSSIANLTVIDPPLITTQPANQAVAPGATITFSVTVSGTTPLNYQWRKDGSVMIDGGNVSGSATATLTLNDVSLSDMAGYSVVTTNAGGSVTSVTATLTVIVPPSITMQPASCTNVAGTSAAFTVTATGTPPLSYQWSFNETNISGATNTMLTLTNIQFSQAGNYAALVTNAYGSVLSSNAMLTVVTGVVDLITFDDLPDTTSGLEVPTGYHGLTWNNFRELNGLAYPTTSGYQYGVVSASNVAFNVFGDPPALRWAARSRWFQPVLPPPGPPISR